MAPTRTLAAFLIFATAKMVAAYPSAGQPYPEVIPGPGLPSLAEIGLTSADLYTMGLNETGAQLNGRAAQFNDVCSTTNNYAPVGDVIACYNYLLNLGTTQCVVPPGNDDHFVVFCTSDDGQAGITGISLNGAGSSSYCRDVATGVLWIINSCTKPDQTTAGFAAAGGNGNLIVSAVRP